MTSTIPMFLLNYPNKSYLQPMAITESDIQIVLSKATGIGDNRS